MNRLMLLPIIMVLASSMPSFAQPATALDLFNKASKEYVKQDKMQALRTLDLALQQYPGDPRLLKLAEELVKEEQQQQQKEQQQQQQKQEEQQQEQERKDQQQAQEQKEQEKKDQEQAQQEKQKQEQEKQGQEQQAQNAQEGETGQPRAGTIAPQDAMRMLDALERSEKDVQEKVRVKLRPATRRSIQKDW
ncbi:MAG: hypothetical protein JNL43_16105 [Flavobacteriales bacterium]|nr:hypothetical protein [Flavobacteriales bacterium]